MSKFFKALEQADRDRLAGQVQGQTLQAVHQESTTPVAATLATAEHPVEAASDADVSAAGDRVDEHLVSLLQPTSFEAEQYRALRHLLEHQKEVANLALVAVSSPVVGDGKTTTAINLAGALAQHPNARVLLIDADLRRPTIARLLGLGRPGIREIPGLVDLIAKPGRALDAVVQARPAFNLDILPAGAAPETPYELIQSARFAEILAETRQRYDYVVLDTPPLLDVPDGRVIGKLVDGMLIVVCAHQTPRKFVKEALSLADPNRVLGLVFNRDSRPIAAYHGGYQHPYAGNGHDPSRWSASR